MLLITPDGKSIVKLDKFDQLSIKSYQQNNYKKSFPYYCVSGKILNEENAMFSLHEEWIPIIYFNDKKQAEDIFALVCKNLKEGNYCLDLNEYYQKEGLTDYHPSMSKEGEIHV